MSATGAWADLRLRAASGLVIAALGLAAIWAGGVAFALLAMAAAAVMVWELAHLQEPERGHEAFGLAALAAGSFAASLWLMQGWSLSAVALPGLAALLLGRRHHWVFALYGTALIGAALALVWLRQAEGLWFLLWLVGVVAACDIAGYFAGRAIGGPKFAPRISPKKTWAGVLAGWAAAGLVGIGFVLWAGADWSLVAISVAMAFASQLGDIAESAVKRRAGVKDASHLIPGHGGLLDRFDALLGAALFAAAIGRFVAIPGSGG